MAKKENTHRVLVGKLEGRRSFRKPRHRREVNIKVDLQEMRCEGMDRNNLVKNRDRVGCCEHGSEPWHCLKVRNFVNS
jgi:hypothetical protein